MTGNFLAVRDRSTVCTVIYHPKRLMARGFVDWTRDVAGFARLSRGEAVKLSKRIVKPSDRIDILTARHANGSDLPHSFSLISLIAKRFR